MDTVGLRGPTKQIRDFTNFNVGSVSRHVTAANNICKSLDTAANNICKSLDTAGNNICKSLDTAGNNICKSLDVFNKYKDTFCFA
jgi:hypothetical protein